jgi:flagellar hook-length control protein FliK
MIRRLHEIEPPKLALPSEKSNKSEDSTAQESLASEFKKLLERARSGLSGARDEVSALGFALAQAVSTVRQQKVEIHGPEETQDVDSGLEDVEVVDGQSDQTEAMLNGPVTNGRLHGSQTGPTDNVGGEEEHVSTDVENFDEGEVVLEGDGEEIHLDEEIVYADVEDLDLGTEVSTDTLNLAAQLVSQQNQASQNVDITQDATDVEVQLEMESGLTRVVQNSADEGDDEEFVEEYVDDDISSQIATSSLSRPQVATKSSDSRSSDNFVAQDPEIEQFLTKYQDDGDTSTHALGDDAQFRATNGEGRGGIDVDRMMNSQKREIASWTPTAPVEGFSPIKERNSELSMQLTLLRQAFDSLKAQTVGTSDSKSRSAASGISGVGAASEPRAAQNDNAPRVAKYLNRATSQKMLERIETALKEAAKSRDGKTITLRLEPLQLGQVKCDVSLRDGLLQARITPQNPEVLHTLRDNAHELQGALRRLGLNVDRVTVQVLGEKDPTNFASTTGFLDGKSFQENGNNMPGRGGQTPEKTFGNEIADVTRAGTPDAGITPADHWIA